MDLNGCVILVTGGAKRVGREIVLALAEAGARPAIHYHRSGREAQRLARTIVERGFPAPLIFKADLRDVLQIKKMIGRLKREAGGLFGIVHNASVFRRTPFGRITDRHWDEHLALHLKAPFFIAQEAFHPMKKWKKPGRARGKIVMIADWVGLRPFPGYLAYSVSKGALILLTQALAQELGPRVQVNCVCPGPVLNPVGLSRRRRSEIAAATRAHGMGTPQDVVDAVLYLLRAGRFVTGSVLTVDGGRALG